MLTFVFEVQEKRKRDAVDIGTDETRKFEFALLNGIGYCSYIWPIHFIRTNYLTDRMQSFSRVHVVQIFFVRTVKKKHKKSKRATVESLTLNYLVEFFLTAAPTFQTGLYTNVWHTRRLPPGKPGTTTSHSVCNNISRCRCDAAPPRNPCQCQHPKGVASGISRYKSFCLYKAGWLCIRCIQSTRTLWGVTATNHAGVSGPFSNGIGRKTSATASKQRRFSPTFCKIRLTCPRTSGSRRSSARWQYTQLRRLQKQPSSCSDVTLYGGCASSSHSCYTLCTFHLPTPSTQLLFARTFVGSPQYR
eukprot:284818031_2